jgi:hypothetical protein
MANGMMQLLLGVKKDSDGMRMLRCILHRYGVYGNYRIDWCYDKPPPSRALDRVDLIMAARERLEAIWLSQPGVIIGFGWMSCELLTGRGKTRLKDTVGTKWTYASDNIARTAWISYDPDSLLFDPALAVDIAAVIVAAGREAGLPMLIHKNESLDQMNRIWKRYL